MYEACSLKHITVAIKNGGIGVGEGTIVHGEGKCVANNAQE